MPEKIEKMSLVELLEVLMLPHKIKRAKRIKNKEVTVQEATEKHVKAQIRDYHLLIDLKNRSSSLVLIRWDEKQMVRGDHAKMPTPYPLLT